VLTRAQWPGEPPSFAPVGFETFCAKAFSGIGNAHLHESTVDRTIPVLLKRKLPTDPVQRFRARDFEEEACALREAMSTWIEEIAEDLATARPELPDELDAAGGRWPTWAREAAVELSTEPDVQDLPLSVLLLSDLRKIFNEHSWTMSSQELCNYLNQLDESPWKTWSTHNIKTGLAPRALAVEPSVFKSAWPARTFRRR
jgi:hypothetical protein